MFTGIVEELGTVEQIESAADSARLTVHGPLVVSDAVDGASIAINGVCLTVTEHDVQSGSFTVDVMQETLSRSGIGRLEPDDPVNLERAMAATARFGGHIVQGHVDGTATVLSRTIGEGWEVLAVSLRTDLAPYVVEMGSIAVDGVSLTVSALTDQTFEVSLIPTTLAATTLGSRAIGDQVNLEVDVIAKYVERLLGDRAARAASSDVAR